MATFTNFATLSYNGATINSNVVTGEILEDLNIVKEALTPVYSLNRPVTYLISLRNTSNNDLTGVTITDNLGQYDIAGGTATPLSYVDGSLRLLRDGEVLPTPAVTVGPPLTVSNLTVPANNGITLVYETNVTNQALLTEGSTITNTATAQAPTYQPVTAQETISVAERPYLRIEKAVSPNTVAENEPVTYTFTLENFGNTPTAADGNLVISDNFNPVLSNLTAELNGTPLALNTDYTYNAASGAFATTPGRIVIPAATYTQNADGTVVTTPGTATLTITGNI